MKRTTNLFVAITIISAFALSSCYKEGPKISFRTKSTRLVGEWTLVDYEVNGSTDQAKKDAWKSTGDSLVLLFVINETSYGFNIQYPKGSGKILSNKPEQASTYAAFQNTFKDNVIFSQRLAGGGHWTFTDKFKKVRFGITGNPDVAYDNLEEDAVEADILMLKNDKLKLSFNNKGETHTMTFEAWEQ
jgi:hypothetical protein